MIYCRILPLSTGRHASEAESDGTGRRAVARLAELSTGGNGQKRRSLQSGKQPWSPIFERVSRIKIVGDFKTF
jgi:hypothetical protein